MSEKKGDWQNIPDIQGLSVDWDFEPENPLGKRAEARVDAKELRKVLGINSLPARVVGENYDEKCLVLDLAANGIALLVKTPHPLGRALKVGFILGQEKIVANVVVRNCKAMEGGQRLGLEFMGLKPQFAEAIKAAVTAKAFGG